MLGAALLQVRKALHQETCHNKTIEIELTCHQSIADAYAQHQKHQNNPNLTKAYVDKAFATHQRCMKIQQGAKGLNSAKQIMLQFTLVECWHHSKNCRGCW